VSNNDLVCANTLEEQLARIESATPPPQQATGRERSESEAPTPVFPQKNSGWDRKVSECQSGILMWFPACALAPSLGCTIPLLWIDPAMGGLAW